MGRPTKGQESSAKARKGSAERMFAGGESCRDIAIQLHISNETVRRWKKDWVKRQAENPGNKTPKPYCTGLRWYRQDFV